MEATSATSITDFLSSATILTARSAHGTRAMYLRLRVGERQVPTSSQRRLS
jgi:hypothetical protein